MAEAVGVWLEAFARIGRTEAAQAAGTEPSRRREGDGGAGVPEGGGKGGAVQETRQRSSCGLSDSDAVACMLMDRFAPA